MPCLSENLIVAFFTRGASADVVTEVDAHTATCEACRRLLAEYAQMSAGQTRPLAEASAVHASAVSAAAPSLTPGSGDHAAFANADLAHRLAQAQARKYVGTVLKGKWQVEALLGTGGMAHVFAARHRNGRRVAIKIMRPELALEPALVERFLREGYVANKIEHPGAVAILDDDVADDGAPFLVMELLVGKTLRQRLADGPLSIDEALRVTADVLDVLAVAHDKGIVHRDLKPDNLFQTESGAIKVLDFGIARLKERMKPEFETRSGMTMGTVGYMPPEQARGLSAEVDSRTDVWAAGATLFALLTGRTVHEASTTNEALLLAMTVRVRPMREELPWLPPAAAAVLDRALAFERDERFPSARAMKEALDAARRTLDTTVLLVAAARSHDPSHGTTVALAPTEAAREVPQGLGPVRASETMIERAFSRRGTLPASPASRRLVLALGIGLLLLVAGATALRLSGSRATTFPASPPPTEPIASVVSAAGIPGGRSADPAAGASAALAIVTASGAPSVDAPPKQAPAPTAPRPSTRPPSSPPTSVRPAHTAAASPSATSAAAPASSLDPLGPRH